MENTNMNETELILKEFGEMPEFESGENVSLKELTEKIRKFLEKFQEDLAPVQFLEILIMYPESLCKRDMSDTLKRVITAYYTWGVQKPLCDYEQSLDEWEKKKIGNKPEKNKWFDPYFSYDQISVLFGRSKASIHEAISQFKNEYEQLYFKQKDELAEFQAWKKTKQTSD